MITRPFNSKDNQTLNSSIMLADRPGSVSMRVFVDLDGLVENFDELKRIEQLEEEHTVNLQRQQQSVELISFEELKLD